MKWLVVDGLNGCGMRMKMKGRLAVSLCDYWCYGCMDGCVDGCVAGCVDGGVGMNVDGWL